MDIIVSNINGVNVAVIESDGLVIADAQSALDLLATMHYSYNCRRMVLYKEAIVEDFFRLSTGVAGEILQKFSTYSVKLAIIGDFTMYTSKPLQDFIYECNQGNQIMFVASEQIAIEKLTAVV